MNPLFLAITIASALSIEAENRIMKTLAVKPDSMVAGNCLVSVIIPAYNEERYLPALLHSIENQTYGQIEVIVVDNVSDDSTIEIAESMGALVLSNLVPANLSLSRNMGAKAARGDIFIFIDADSIPESNAIEKTVESLQNNDIVYTNRCCTDSHFQSFLRVAAGWLSIEPLSVSGMYIAVTRRAFESIGGFDETALPMEGRGEDVEFVNTLLNSGANIKMLKNTYVATSARRQKAEGYIVPKHFQSRAIRGIEIQRNNIQVLSR